MKISLFTLLALFIGIATAGAVPPLQLYINGASYDSQTETWIITDESEFELYVVGEPRDDDELSATDHRELEDVYLIVSTDSEMEPNEPIRIDERDYPDDGWTFGSPSVEPEFPPHGIFPAWFLATEIGEFSDIGGIGDVVPDSLGYYFDPSNGYVDSSNHTGEIKRFEIDIPPGITNVHFDAVSLDDDRMMIFAPFSHDAGYYNPESYPPTDIHDAGPVVPNRMVVLESYPNPFNAETTVKFTLPAASEIQLELYDLQGRRVVTLAKGAFDAGVQSLIWDGNNSIGQTVASGVYLIKLTTPDVVTTKNIILLK